MTVYQFFRPVIIGTLVLFLILGFFSFYVCKEMHTLFDVGPSEEYTPQEGVWYCSVLQMQLSFSKQHHSRVVIDEEEIKCAWRNDIGSADIYVVCQETDNQVYALGELLLWIEFVSLDEEQYIVKDHNTGEMYIFTRMQ